ncbi:SusC/RagA family TonB-linked outer membrane protein [Solitalea koreensis]|uniref:TonB-linked outer membrane protein, SusC/RagA family n=1 Tax=Solitalea koreensis TaxID=543615 RepID=A0A521DKL3_9SPHI|nr:SusC/RagA family TonB-linked outer membrane protein [Solitalea koreensis]SMO72273.1 TonB-linked outer membrane protein, SusC/RagA family [Solitalea koreensis]
MRLTTVILIVSLLQVSAATFGQHITLNQKNISLKAALREITRQSGYGFYYDGKVIGDDQKVDIKLSNSEFDEALNSVLSGLGLTYKIDGKIVAIKKEKSFLDKVIDALKAIDISGRVVDETGNPLAGAAVSIVKVDGKIEDFDPVKYKGRTAAAITNANGEFLIKNVDEGSIVIISYTGYKEFRAKAVKDMGVINMVINAENLEEVQVRVNTGYQSISSERSAGSIAKPDLNIMKNRSGTMNVIQRLDGLVPGLTINNAPNATGPTILFRGLTSINGNKNPLFVVNGIPMDDISSLNPNDIEDVTVLKDATAASIWGARAANGVVVIVTKKGRNSEKVTIDYDAFMNFQGKPQIDYFPVLSSTEFIQTARDLFDPVTNPWATVSTPTAGGRALVAPHEMILYNQSRGLITKEQADAQLAVLAGQNNVQEIKDLWYRNAGLMNHSLSVSGGGNKYSFYGSGAYTNTLNSTPGSKNDNYGLNLRQDFRFNDRFQAYLITDLRNNTISSKNTVSPDNRFLPYVMFKNADGTNAGMPWMYRTDALRQGYESKSLISLDYNPLNEVDYGNTKTNNFYGRLTSGLTVKLLKGLRYEGVYGYARGNNKSTNLLDEKNFSVRNELVSFTVAPTTAGGLPTYYLPSSGGKYTVGNINQRNWTVRNQFIYDNSWKDEKHQLTLLAGQEAQENFNSSITSVVRGYNSQLLSYTPIDYALLFKTTTLNNSVPPAGVVYYGAPVMPSSTTSSFLPPDQYSETEQTVRFTSYYANGGYTYNKKYTVNASWRIDQSNLFGRDKSAQNKPVWSAGASWGLGKENLMANISWLDRLVLRTSYGISGNSPDPGSAASFDVLSKTTNGFAVNLNALNISTPGNKKLSWETTKTTNIGIDFAVLKNRISGSIDLYNKNTENLIGFTPVNPFTGYANITGNIGNMNNKGVELSLKTVNLQLNDFRWSTLFNFAYNKNKLTKYNTLLAGRVPSTAIDILSQTYLEGYSAFSLFAYQFAGLDNLGDPQIRLKDGTITKSPTAAKIEDLKYMGTYQPIWSGGFTNVFDYKGFSLALNMIYNLGHVMRKDVNFNYVNTRLIPFDGSFTLGNINEEFARRWKVPGDEAFTNVPSYVTSNAINSSRRNTDYYTRADINVLDASYVKLRDASLAYSLPKSVLSKLKVSNLTLRTQLSNVMLWKANKAGIDPEFQNAFGLNGGTRTAPFNQHTFTVGAHLTF